MSGDCFDLAIVGGGPAGQAAAETACDAGLRVVMLDEQPRMGGQILRQPPADFTVARWMVGDTYQGLRAQLARTQSLDALDWRGGHSVLGLFPTVAGFRLLATGEAGRCAIHADRVLIAGGCYDMPVAFPGWTLPGVMSAGGVQAFVKSQQIVPGDRFVFAGTHPLQLLVADQVRRAGGAVEAVCFAQPLARMMQGGARDPAALVRQLRAFRDAAAAWAGVRRAGIAVRFGVRLRSALGTNRVAEASFDDGRTIACDRIATCYGFLPQSDLPRQAGCATRRDPATGGVETIVDDWGRTNVPALFAAGETTGVAGAEIALREGRLAGLGIALDAGLIPRHEASRRAAPIRRELARLRRFALRLADIADPRDAIAGLADDDTIVCRCEDVTRGDLLAALRVAAGPGEASALKLVSRAGMGVCQGRSCEHAVRAILAEAGRAPAEGFTARFPARPVAIADLIGDG